ncbi:MAG: UDP-N-acetylmuramoyl-tripeptide--D-alanyl-D-alanine ligase [Clostridiales bacterium]|nr:UDP-N-acetylmuramoyl-tripeptide--D-alanyl-D-alanine ligase [Clostridiales bacterium]
MTVVSRIFASLLAAAACLLCSRRLAHLYQLESYQLAGYFRSVRRGLPRILIPGFICALAGLLPFLFGAAPVLCALCSAVAGAAVWYTEGKKKQKKPFVVTERVRRFYAIHALLALLLALLLSGSFAFLLLPAFECLILALSACLAKPLEAYIANQFVADAKRRLDEMPNLIRIGITGSYGKTSTKFLLRDILSVRWNVLATPGSFNTTMGVTRVIREMLTPTHEVFIAEMGARHPGDIRELVNLVRPNVGILTSIGPQHLDTFGSVETIAKTKNELIEGLPENGTAIFARDGAYCEKLFNACGLQNKILAGERIAAEEVEVGPWGTRFLLSDRETGESIRCETRLLGRHTVENLLLCAAAARQLGLSMDEIERGIARCQPVEHRLQLLPAIGGITIIDDAFNSNPAGAKAAIDVLSHFPERRVVVTPGMVELGAEEAKYNREFGKQMAEACDLVILVGERHTLPIAEGLKEAGFPEEKVCTVASFAEAQERMKDLLKAGDTVLYENDLPDNYEG